MIDIIMGAGTVLSAILIFTPKNAVGESRVSWSLVWFVLAFSAFLCFSVARQTTGPAALVLAGLAGTAYAALFPVQYLFVRDFVGDSAHRVWPHAALPVLNVLLSILLASLAEVDATDGVFSLVGISLRWMAYATLGGAAVAMLYPLAGLRRLLRARAAHRITGGARTARHFTWLIVWCCSTVAIALVAIGADIAELMGEASTFRVAIMTYGLLCAQLTILGIYVTRNGRAFEAVAGKPADFTADAAELARFLQTSKAYRQAGLSADKLAGQIGWTTTRLGAAIRTSGSSHFNDYINGWRVDDVAGAIRTGAFTTILDAAFDAGFGSKSSFNEAFKRRFGLSPSQFRDQVKTG